MALVPGMKASLVHTVEQSDLASSWKNDIPVFATPIVLWLAELACIKAIEGELEPGLITAGYRHEVYHSAPTPEGWVVNFEAELVHVEGKMLTFEISAHDGADVILSGRHIRAVLGRERFIEKVRRKASQFPAHPERVAAD